MWHGAKYQLAAIPLLVIGSCAATLSVRATAPMHENSGTCGDPVLDPMTDVAAPVWLHFAWAGPSGQGEDSSAVLPGERFTFQRHVRSGVYLIRSWASDAGGTGCADSIVVSVKGAPDKVKIESP